MKFLYYTLIRLGLLLVVFYLCWRLGTGLVLAGVFGVLISFAVAYLAFPRLHTAAGEDMARLVRRRPRRENTVAREDAAAEDDYVEDQLRREGRDL